MCDYCKTRLDVDDTSTIPGVVKPIIDVKWKDIGIEANLLVETLFVNVDIYDDDGESKPWKSEVIPINYCPMCGRKLKGGKN